MEQHGISKLDLKRRNRTQVLKVLKQRGPTSRIDIAASLELTRAAVTIITNEMIDQGILEEVGEFKHISEKAPRGRKKILIDINYHYKFAFGVTVEENIISVGLTTLAGEILDKRNRSIDSEADNRESILYYVEKSIREIMNDNCLNRKQILGIGCGIYPSMHEVLGIESKNDIPDYSNLIEYIATYTDLPVVFGNSVKGTAMANIDFLKNVDLNRESMALLQYGNSIDFVAARIKMPIIVHHNKTNFVDQIIIEPNSSEICPVCKRRGCVKNELTASAVKRKVQLAYSKDKMPYLYQQTGGDKNKINGEFIMEAFKNGDKEIVRIINRALERMALLINNLYFITNPQKIILHMFYFDSDIAFDLMKNTVEDIAGKEVADSLELSVVDRKHRFLSGCALAVRELFFEKGGFDK